MTSSVGLTDVSSVWLSLKANSYVAPPENLSADLQLVCFRNDIRVAEKAKPLIADAASSSGVSLTTAFTEAVFQSLYSEDVLYSFIALRNQSVVGIAQASQISGHGFIKNIVVSPALSFPLVAAPLIAHVVHSLRTQGLVTISARIPAWQSSSGRLLCELGFDLVDHLQQSSSETVSAQPQVDSPPAATPAVSIVTTTAVGPTAVAKKFTHSQGPVVKILSWNRWSVLSLALALLLIWRNTAAIRELWVWWRDTLLGMLNLR
eukprot:TRINITY_DN13766_c0_g1_i1.p1 TRINITY_DN13766_c0_g1~~TRINITY_DN13766_c0_g1_i1.p1  ORF type:complete len:262 (-),score=35.82 TRINITY_DN13766_c0_g1_i1:27-812(-)